MGVCILSSEERGRLEHYGIPPVCSEHKHTSSTSAIRRIKLGELELLDVDGHQYCLRPILCILKPTKSQLMPVIQRVRGNPQKHIQPARFSRLD